ncbi:hypothetical protein BJJLLNOG_00136 [Ostreid herpesvirus 1]|nr:hypothetical protein MHEDPEIF_00002 [Ostreid herpesvirus 1]UPX73106.1 hypothetical protein MHEDPEIF_00142 [Ostreid herpesvirus 1]UPX73133.1 hypothetical protein ANDDGIFB_00002 [Ostreid herpesvirus 1]UPX73275.1 hypothetical protein ANDDGIFB_00144 [Ostreid herpesvirus 1]UPX73469.1 hypothetical protein HCIIPDEM_00002 [Ostreid herpesvirus 1]
MCFIFIFIKIREKKQQQVKKNTHTLFNKI